MQPSSRVLPILSAAVVAAFTFSGCSSPSDPPDGATATVTRVVDGDTIVVDYEGHDVTIRLIGVDTPETKKPNTPVQCFGPEASARTTELLPAGTPVRLERDVEARDKYDRLLAYVHRQPDDLFINAVLIDEGLARPLRFPPNTTYANEFQQAADTAKANDVGLWGACPEVESP